MYRYAHFGIQSYLVKDKEFIPNRIESLRRERESVCVEREIHDR